MLHIYVHDGAAAGKAVASILQELAHAAEAHVRVTALEVVVNLCLRVELLAHTRSPDSSSPASHLPNSQRASCKTSTATRLQQGTTDSKLGQGEREAMEDGTDSERIQQILNDVRVQLVRLIGWAHEEQKLDAVMSDAAVSALLLLCRHKQQWDSVVVEQV